MKSRNASQPNSPLGPGVNLHSAAYGTDNLGNYAAFLSLIFLIYEDQ